jgi:hypothetical protein
VAELEVEDSEDGADVMAVTAVEEEIKLAEGKSAEVEEVVALAEVESEEEGASSKWAIRN